MINRNFLLRTGALVCLTAPFSVSPTAGCAQGVPFKNGVEVTINGQGPFAFGLDTGAALAFWINPELAQQLNLPVTSHARAQASSDADVRVVDVLRIDDLELAGHSFRHVVGLGFSKSGNGVLGIELFKDVSVTLDYPGDRLSVSDQSLPVADGKHIFNYAEIGTTPVLPMALGGVPVNARLDTGARDTRSDVMVPLGLASRLRLTAPMQPGGIVQDAMGHDYKRYTATLDGDLTIGELTVHDPTLLISEAPYVYLGGICDQLVITLDHRNHRVELELPSSR
jgi:hypothetical protein